MLPSNTRQLGHDDNISFRQHVEATTKDELQQAVEEQPTPSLAGNTLEGEALEAVVESALELDALEPIAENNYAPNTSKSSQEHSEILAEVSSLLHEGEEVIRSPQRERKSGV